jgi:hypothetical protein
VRRTTIPALVLAAALCLCVPASPAGAATLAPADGATYEAQTALGITFSVAGAPRLAPVHVVVARSAALRADDVVDFIGLSADLGEPGTYRGLSAVGGWAARPGTYFWQARDGAGPLGPVRRIVIGEADRGLPALRRAESRRAARTHLRREFRSYRRGTARRVRCARVSRMHMRCSVSWRFRDLRYTGRVEVTAGDEDVLVARSRIRRRA